MKNVHRIWSSENNRISVISNGYTFEAMIHASSDWQVILSVGWSSGNLAWRESDEETVSLSELTKAAEKAANAIEWGSLQDQLPNLFAVCKAVDTKYNDLLYSH